MYRVRTTIEIPPRYGRHMEFYYTASEAFPDGDEAMRKGLFLMSRDPKSAHQIEAFNFDGESDGWATDQALTEEMHRRFKAGEHPFGGKP